MTLDPRAFRDLSRCLAPSAGGAAADRALSEGLITAGQFEECVREQDRTGRPLDTILVSRGFLEPGEAARLSDPSLPAEAAAALADPARIAKQYLLVERLGRGGMGEIWRAWDRSLGRWVAIKFLKPEVGGATRRIEREGKMAGRLSHPNIIPIFERGRHEGRPYLVMPLVDARTSDAPLPPREAVRIALEVASALVHVHRMGVIHRDVKPGNVLVDRAGRVLLADFGLAVADDGSPSAGGTPGYASPEQLCGEPLDARTDVYSLGATLYQMLSGRPPFSGATPQDVHERILRETPPLIRGVPSALAGIVGRALEREPGRRYAGVDAMAEDLRRWAERAKRSVFLRPASIAAVLLAWPLSLGLTYLFLLAGADRERDAIRFQIRWRGVEDLEEAERLRGEPSATREEVDRIAKRALREFKLAARAGDPRGLERGRCHEILGEERSAERAYREAGSAPAARRGLARIRLRRALEGRGKSPAEGESGDPVEALFLRVIEERWEDAFAIGDAAVKESPLDEMVPAALGVAALRLGKSGEAVRRMEDAVKIDLRNPTLWHYKGLAHAGAGDAPTAEEAFARARSLANGAARTREDPPASSPGE